MTKMYNGENFDEIIKNRVLVDFYADWCGPCTMLSPILEDMTDISVIKVNVDKFPNIANEYKVMSIPKLVYVKDGKVVAEQVGLQSEEDIRNTYNNIK